MLFYAFFQRSKAFVYGKINSKMLILRVRKMSFAVTGSFLNREYSGRPAGNPGFFLICPSPFSFWCDSGSYWVHQDSSYRQRRHGLLFCWGFCFNQLSAIGLDDLYPWYEQWYICYGRLHPGGSAHFNRRLFPATPCDK